MSMSSIFTRPSEQKKQQCSPQQTISGKNASPQGLYFQSNTKTEEGDDDNDRHNQVIETPANANKNRDASQSFSRRLQFEKCDSDLLLTEEDEQMEEQKDYGYEEEDPNENEIINRLLNIDDAQIRRTHVANDTSFKRPSYLVATKAHTEPSEVELGKFGAKKDTKSAANVETRRR